MCSAQHSILMMLELRKETIDKNEAFGTLITDLSNAYDCLSLNLLVAKLQAYGLELPSLKLIPDYL